MNGENFLKNYELSQDSTEKLKIIKEKLKEDINQADPWWQVVNRKKAEITYMNEEETLNESNENENCSDIITETSDQLLSTQFYFTQFDKSVHKNTKQEHVPKFDLTEYLLEGLECPNGKLDLSQLENLTDIEFIEIICNLEKKLSTLGIYNLCYTMNNMTLEQRMKYAEILHTHLLLPKIIALKEPTRSLVSVLIECTKKFPDDIQKLIFIPLLNIDLIDTTIIIAIINAFEFERYSVLITDYLTNVKELKLWHISFLQTLISTKIDISMNNKLIQLLHEKATDFSKDKNFGKFILSFIKLNIKFSNEQIHLLWEIGNINQTLFKKPVQNILKSMLSL